MKKPSFQFYPADWRNNAKLRRCTWEARGAWLEVMCLLHDSEEYGLLRWSLKELAQAIGAPLKLLKELVDKDVLKGGDKSFAALVYTPRSGRVDGEPVTLIAAGVGACWFSSRMVIDEHIRIKKGEGTRFTSPPKQPPNPSPMGGIGEGLGASPNSSPPARQSDGSTYSSTSTTTLNTKEVTHSLSLAPGCVSDFENIENENQIQVDSKRIAKALDLVGLPSVSHQHPELLAWIKKGVTQEQFVDAARIAVSKNKGFAYMIGVVEGQIRDAVAVGGVQIQASKPWNADPQSVVQMAEKLGVKPWQQASSENAFRGEAYTVFLMRVTEAYDAKNGVAA